MKVSQRKLAGIVLMTLAGREQCGFTFSASGFYDNDFDVLVEIIEKAGFEKEPVKRSQERIRRVCRKLAQYGILATRMEGTQKEYLGEPARQQDYWFANPSHAMRLRPDLHPHLHPHYHPEYSPDFELNYLLDCVYGHQDGGES